MDDTENKERPVVRPLTRWSKLRRRIGWMTLFALLALAGTGALLLRYAPLPAGATMQSTRIVDYDGKLIASLQGGVNRQIVKLSDISPWLVKATLAVEDRRFYEHAGVDLHGLARAAWVDVRHMSKQQGASTLTQQLARNLYLSHERTWTRKLKEAWYAARLEQTYSKNEILELYLNQIYYGHGAYGAEAASKLYFNKPAKELTIAESALLAGIPKGPRYYSPHLHPTDSQARQRKVLQAMQETGRLSKEQAALAARRTVNVRPLPEEEERAAPYFADYVKKIVIDQIGIEERLLNEGGLTIRTTLDGRMQEMAEAAVKKGLKGGNPELQTALIALDPRNGYIKAMVGGRNYRNNQFNRVFASTRQPGSSFKPIMYASALEEHAVTPATRFRSEPTLFYFDHDRQIYRPSNYNDRYFNGEIGMRQAIAASDNIYAVNTIMQVGPDAVISMARKLGITSSLKAVPSLALGTFPVSPFEMASAFSVFANEGRRSEPIAITSIVDRNGKVLYESHPRQEQVLSPALSYVTTGLMESVFDRGGTAHRVANLLKRPVAGKTGTTDSDAWFVGYTPELTTAVWVGYDRGRSITSSEAHRAAPIFAQFTESALEGTPPHVFPMPEGVVSVYVDPATNLLASPQCPGQAVLETFLSGTEPKESCAPLGGSSDGRDEDGSGNRSIWSKFRRWVGV
ncbi:transglycosylase domain-containing protein [Cohnella luojiensis]|uniref:PBP1A family penicillin-binding protein n=1 Tax=Cohnella luojiensis TaxID=652876 RepID=A0A4Y8LW54_9BACL|nr:PBP1A family penicillin-binding protein [Cohnella luojiensis]TFE26084.1 PBP1A family penicillin-binding protein [Cohnella luojiensis]